MKNLQSVVASVGDSLHSNLPLEIKNVPARYHRDLTVRELGQHLQSFLRLGRDDGQCWLLSEVRKEESRLPSLVLLGVVASGNIADLRVPNGVAKVSGDERSAKMGFLQCC